MFNYDVNEKLWNIYDCLVVLKHIIVSWDSSKDVEKQEMSQTTNQMVIFDGDFHGGFHHHICLWDFLNSDQWQPNECY